MSHFGFVNCNKPPGMTSRDVVNIVQGKVRPLKAGHCGTLDPLASGVLVVGVGPAVRLTSYVQECVKRYTAEFRLGAASETGDLEKGFTEYPELPEPTSDQLKQAAARLVGSIIQVPPAYSAIWVDGQRAYKRVRKGQTVEMPARTVKVHTLDILRYEFPLISLDIQCGSGTYIRSLGIDLAKAVGSVAVMTKLVRVAVGPFRLHDSISIETLKEQPIEGMVKPAIQGVSHLPRVAIDDQNSIRLGNGLPLVGEVPETFDGVAIAVTGRGSLRAIIREKERGWCPVKVFPTPEG